MTRPQLWPWLLDQSSSIFLISMTPPLLGSISLLLLLFLFFFFAVMTENQDQTTADLRVSVWLRPPWPINLSPKANTKRCPHLEVTLLLHWKVFVYYYIFRSICLQNDNCLFFTIVIFFIFYRSFETGRNCWKSVWSPGQLS